MKLIKNLLTLENLFTAIEICFMILCPYALDAGMYFLLILSLTGFAVFANLSMIDFD